MQKIKKNDFVVVITGKDKGKKGIVKSLDSSSAVVDGVNLYKKHVKPNPQLGVQGGIVEKEASIAISNIAILNKKTQKADKVGFLTKDGKKIRVYKSTGDVIDT